LICLIRAFFVLRAITFFACTSFCFIRQNFMNWASIRFFSSSFSFCNFARMTCFAFSLMSLKLSVSNQQASHSLSVSVKLSVSNRKRLRKNFFLFNFFCFVVCHICSFVSLKSELTIICLVLLIKSRNFSSRTESLHCMFSAILRLHWFFNSCWISIKSWVWRSSDNMSFVVSTCLLKCFNCLIHCFSLIDHISNFSKTCRIIDTLNVLFLIFVKSFKNCSIEYFTNDVTTAFWMIWSCQCL
jgi:hypothetical protein